MIAFNKVLKFTAVAALSTLGVQAYAAEAATTPAVEPASTPNPASTEKWPIDGMYVGGLGFGLLSDGRRDLEFGYGGRGFLGIPISDSLNLELSAYRATADTELTTNHDMYLWGVGIDAMFPFGSGKTRPFLLIGAGFQDEDARFEETDNGYVNAGLGALYSLGYGFDLRADARYVAIFADSGAPESRYDDGQIGLGLQYTFSTPAPKPAQKIVYVAAPPVIGDADGDKVLDNVDQCPNTPAGVQVDARGCPLDSDGDGVPDYLDKCPNTSKGLKVDASGCVNDGQTVVLRDVNFEFNSAQLLATSRAQLESFVAGLKGQPNLRFEVAGHTDSVGSDAYNLRLSEQRAASVRNYLISLGVPANQLVARGYGESQPETTNDTDAGRAQNRRVELKVIK